MWYIQGHTGRLPTYTCLVPLQPGLHCMPVSVSLSLLLYPSLFVTFHQISILTLIAQVSGLSGAVVVLALWQLRGIEIRVF